VALIGFVAGEMAWDDQAISGFTQNFASWMKYVAAAVGALFVVGLGFWLAKRAGEKAGVPEAAPNQEK
jgi:hypothetical protein